MHVSIFPLTKHITSVLVAFLSLWLISDQHVCIAQTSHQIFEHITTEQGLSSDKAEAVIQDQGGFYWIATQNGLNRFDGTSFKVYRNILNDSTSLTNNYCTALVEDHHGDIWVATYRGVSRFIKAKGYFQQIFLTHPTQNFALTNSIFSLAVDNNGDVWIAGNGLWKYSIEDDNITLYQHNPSDPSSITAYGLIKHVVFDEINNGLWISTYNELDFFSISKNHFYHHLHNLPHWKVFEVADGAELTLDNRNRLWFRDKKTQSLCYFDITQNQITFTGQKVSYGINRIKADERGRIWIFYHLAKSEIYDPETATSDTSFFVVRHRHSILREQGNSLFIDKQNNYWITTYNGINIYNENNQYYKLHSLVVAERGIEKDLVSIYAMAQTEPSHIWIGTNLGLFKYNLKTGNYKRINESAVKDRITTLCADGDKLWIGIKDHVLCLDTKREVVIKKINFNPGIFFIRKGSQKELWIGLWQGGLYRLHVETGDVDLFKSNSFDSSSIKSNSMLTGFTDGENFWVGHNGENGFSKYSSSAHTFTHHHPQLKDLSNSGSGTITAITKDNYKHLWLGTHGSGIFRYDPLTNTYENYQQQHQQGLNSNFINSIITDARGNLWISTADGMNYLNPAKNRISQLDIDLIFLSNNVVPNGVNGLNDKLFFYCKNEFIEVIPGAYRPDTTFPHVVISGFRIFDEEVAVYGQQESISLSHRQNFFSFEFSTIKANPLKEVTYAYMLEGFDKDWNIADHQNQANYTNVPEGKYQFKIKATNDEEVWSDTLLRLPINIHPPFWRTWWFYMVCFVFIAGGIYTIYQYRVRQLRRIYSIKSKISRDLHDDVGASLSSIHIYSSVAEKAIQDNPQKAERIVGQIKQNSRQVMESMSDIIWAMNAEVPDGETLAGRIKNYGQDLLSQKNIECVYHVDTQVEKRLVKPEARKNVLMIVKEALNNIAKYSEATHAEVSITADHTHLDIRVTDNGKGFDPGSVNGGNGLHNMKLRSDALGGSFEVNSVTGRGTGIHSSIPIAKISDR